MYFFILDMYSRDDALREFYGHDNSGFLGFLEDRGFRIARNSFSNYGNTEASVTTTLFMDYFMPIVYDGSIDEGTPTFRDPDSAVPLVTARPGLFGPEAATFQTGTYGWRAEGDNTIENEEQILKVTHVAGSERGARLTLDREHGLLEDLVAGHRYRLSAWLKAEDSTKIRMVVAGEGVASRTEEVGPTYEPRVLDFVAASATGHFVSLVNMEAGDVVWIDRLELLPLGSSMNRVLSDVQFDFQPDSHVFDAYLGSYQHLSPVLSTFRQLGYRVLFANQAGTPTDACEPYCLSGQQHLTFQQVELLKMTPLYALAARFRPDIWQDLTQFYQKNPLSVVQQIPADVPEPFYLHAHILAPHPPFIYRADCSIRDEFRFELDPGVELFGTGEEMYRQYVEQLSCVNDLVRQTVVEIQDRDPDAIIIFQGDHGLGKLEAGYPSHKSMQARYGILNAWHLPDRCAGYLYDGITPVNTFRLVFACLNGTEPNFVPDRLFENSSYHRKTRDITDSAREVPEDGPE